MRQFAEEEIIVPTGPFEGLKFKCDRQPASGVFFDLVQSNHWNRIFATGPSQAGKSLMAFIIPTLYHLFEVKETVICALPQMKMAHDKWTRDLLPVISLTRYKSLLPTSGQGSRGGEFDSITFTNGVTLKFMSGGGDDKNRASFTSRVVVITEVDGMGAAGGASEETDKIGQIEARTNSFGSNRRIYGECTLTTKEGRTYREINKRGSATRLLVECCRCGHYVSPDRSELVGWQGAENEIEAFERSAFACPDCGEHWSQDERREMHRNLRVIHKGQEIRDGREIIGDPTPTKTLGFRFNAFNNLLVTAGDVGQEEFNAARDPDGDNAERKMTQFFWALPFVGDKTEDVPLDALVIGSRTNPFERGKIPSGTSWITCGVDVGKWWVHWSAIAWFVDGTSQVIAYGQIAVETATLGEEIAIQKALRAFRDLEKTGWQNPDGTRRRADRVVVDSGYKTNIVYQFVLESGQGRYWAGDGRGQSSRKAAAYQHPKQITTQTPIIGDQYHVSIQPGGIALLAMNADHWKGYLHRRFATPPGQRGAMMLHDTPDRHGHLDFAKQITAEKFTESFIQGKGLDKKWVKTHRKNHQLDACYYACVAGHLTGVRLTDIKFPDDVLAAQTPPPAPPAPAPEPDRSAFVRQPARREKKSWVRGANKE